ncbi:MAG: Uma2 family endonuclease [Verrucomicrobia bacterium]|nr:Uma2 family endonuclease [Verrucomicrobiota bacterium]
MVTTTLRRPTRQRTGRRWTFAEWRAEIAESNLPAELWDGEAIVSPAPSFLHQQIVDRFHDRLKAWVRPRALGKTCTAPVDMVLAPKRSVQPDVLFVGSARLAIIGEVINGPADLVAEIISPESRRRDRFDKRDLYEQHGVREYWLLDPGAETVEVFRLTNGQYRLLGRWRPGESAESDLLPGFAVLVAELYSEG